MFGDPQNEGPAGFVHTADIDFGPLPAKFQNHPVKGVDGGKIPEVGLRDIDHYLVQHLLAVKGLGKAGGRDEEDLPPDAVDTFPTILRKRGIDLHELGNLVGEK